MTDRPTYIATARRSGDWWAIEVPGVEGVHSQARRLDQVDSMAREAIALMLDVPEDSFDLILMPELDNEVTVLLGEVARAKGHLRDAEGQVAAMLRMTAEKLTKQRGLTTRDAGKVMGVSFQRISQLTSGGEGVIRDRVGVDGFWRHKGSDRDVFVGYECKSPIVDTPGFGTCIWLNGLGSSSVIHRGVSDREESLRSKSGTR